MNLHLAWKSLAGLGLDDEKRFLGLKANPNISGLHPFN